MLIFLYGPDDYRRTQKKKDSIAEFAKKRSAQGIAHFDMDVADASNDLAAFLENQPLFEAAKLAVLDNAFETDPARLAKLIAPYADNKTTTILIAERDKPVKALAFLVKPPVLFQEFKNLTGEPLERFVLSEAKRRGVALDAAAVRHLAAVFAGNAWALATELEKLAAFAPKVTGRDLDAFDLVAPPAYWPLVMGVRHADIRNRFTALETLLATGDPPPKIFNILASQWREKTHEMAEYDFAVKSGKLEYDDALLGLVL